MTNSNSYQFLERRPESSYKQLFVKGRKIRAEVLYRETVGLDPQLPEEVAIVFGVPVDAVLEAIHYCRQNKDVLWRERAETSYQHLEPRPGSRVSQLFIKGRKLRAERKYRETVGEDPRTPEQVAEDFDLPLNAVLECIYYCIHNENLLNQDRAEEEARFQEFAKKYPPLRPSS